MAASKDFALQAVWETQDAGLIKAKWTLEKKSQHGVKCIVAQISNRMKCLAGPFMGKTHDCKMLDHSCWLKILAKEAAAGRVWVLFGNAGFQHCCRQ